MTDETTAWGYVRTSQEGGETSLPEQKRSIREYAERMDMALLTTRNDGKRTSGFDEDRDEYQLLRRKVDEEAMDAVITRDRSRLSRDFEERLRLVLLFRNVDVDWHVIEAGGALGVEDTQTAGFECVHAMMDDVKKRAEIQRSKQAIEERLEKGYYQGAVPYGFRFDDEGKYLEPEPDEFEACLEVIDLREAELSYNNIAARVDDVSKTLAMNIIDRREMYEEEYEL